MQMNGVSRVARVTCWQACILLASMDAQVPVQYGQQERDRTRAPRLRATARDAVVQHVRSAHAASTQRRPLHYFYGALLDEACCTELAWSRDIENGKISVLAAMRWRARAILSTLQVQGVLSNWTAAETVVEAEWHNLARASREAPELEVPKKRRAEALTAEPAPKRARQRRRAAPRGESVGYLRCAFDDVRPEELQTTPASWIQLHELPEVLLTRDIGEVLPSRSEKAVPVDKQQRRQLREASEWRLSRFRSTHRGAVFAHGPMARAAKTWQTEAEGRAGKAPPMDVLEPHLQCNVATTITCQPHGQLWTLDAQPLDAVQLAAVLAIPEDTWGMVRAAAQTVSQAEMRGLMGSSVNWLSATAVLQRGIERLGRRPASFATLGSGISMLGAALWALTDRSATYSWFAEGGVVATRAHRAAWASTGQQPRHITRAELSAEQGAASVEAELISLRCAPFSSANRTFPQGVWAAVAELRATMATTFGRRPWMIVYENTAGLLRMHWLRAAVEAELLRSGLYVWELIIARPERQANHPGARRRAYYVGVLRAAPTNNS